MTDAFLSFAVAAGAIILRSVSFCGIKWLNKPVGLSPFEILYLRSAISFPFLLLFHSLRPADPKNSVWKISRTQMPFVLTRVIGSTIANTIQQYALKYLSSSKSLLLMENPFIPGLMAWFLAGEAITGRETFIYAMVTAGLYCISYKEGAMQKPAPESLDKDLSYEIIGIALTCVASGVQAVGIIAMRKLKTANEIVDPVVIVIFISIASLILNSGFLLVFDKHPVMYTQDIINLLILISLTGTAGMVLSSQLYYYFKASWSVVILNL